MMPLGAPSISKYGSLVRPYAQIVALRAHCTRTALEAPPNKWDTPHVHRNSTPGLPHGHQTRVVTLLHASPTLIAEWGTASVARLAALRGEKMDRTQCSMWVAASCARGPLSAG